MSTITYLNMGGFRDTGILVSPYFDGFTSLEKFHMTFSRLHDVDNINLPPSLKILRIGDNRILRFPNVSSRRFPILTELYLSNNDITNISDSDIAGMSSMITRLALSGNNLVELGDVTPITDLGILWLSNNQLQTIPDMLDGLPNLWGLNIGDNTRLTCDRRMCWRRLWKRVRSPLLYGDDVECKAPPAARGHRLSMINPGFMKCDQGGDRYCLEITFES